MRKLSFGLGLVGALLVGTLSVLATHYSAPQDMWGYEASGATSRILHYDLGSDTLLDTCTPVPTGIGRGIAQDPVTGGFYYTFLPGDGFIHITTYTPGTCMSVAIPFGDGPGGVIQDDIGALDFDTVTPGIVWAAGYTPISPGLTPLGYFQIFYRVDSATGTILNECFFPHQGVAGVGNDTLTVADLSPMAVGGGSGHYFLSDAGEILTTLFVFDTADCGFGQITPITSVTTPAGMTGIDYDQVNKKLIATDGTNIYSFGDFPFSTIQATMPAGALLEDITLRGKPTLTPVSAGSATGGGMVPATTGKGVANFGMEMRAPSSGHVEFNIKGGATYHCTVTAVTKVDSTTLNYSCKDQNSVIHSGKVHDGGTPGRNGDTFTFDSDGGALQDGNVQVRDP